MLYPLKFQPIFKERIWGGRNLERLYGKALPPDAAIGESWEISDRPGDVSVIANGPLAGRDLRWLMEQHPRDLLGDTPPQNGRFPLLIKILDAADKLSLQVHPPPHKAAELGGEPKSELWFVTRAASGAELRAGLKRGVTRDQFEGKLKDGTVADCVHRIPVEAGDALFLPSGRIHALGAGVVLFEIQQNSDTTYRVFDWNRVGLDGKPRELHVRPSLASIDFDDFEPALVANPLSKAGTFDVRRLAGGLFNVDWLRANSRDSVLLGKARFKVVGVVEGKVFVTDETGALELQHGEFCLVPPGLKVAELWSDPGASFLLVEPGS